MTALDRCARIACDAHHPDDLKPGRSLRRVDTPAALICLWNR